MNTTCGIDFQRLVQIPLLGLGFVGPFGMVLKPLGFTHVEYTAGDHFGHLLAWASMAPLIIIVAFLTVIATRRELRTIAFFVGLVFSEGICVILKNIFAQARPDGSTLKSYGMPSSHANFVWFFASAFVLFLYTQAQFNWAATRRLLALGAIGGASLVSYSRFYLIYHSAFQVLMGALLGILLGTTWYWVIESVLQPYFDTITSSEIGQFFMLRDSTRIPNVLYFEYVSARNAATKARKTKSPML